MARESEPTVQLQIPTDDRGCEWHGHCIDIPIETIAHIFGFVNTLFSAAELLCYTVLCSALHVILERQKERDVNVCDMSLKTFDDPDDDCEVKASKVAAALLGTSVFEVIISFLALRGAYTQTNVYLCYIWFIFTSLLIIMFPLFQSLFFVVTNWWNAWSYSIMSISVIHSVVKLYGMYIIARFVKWVRENPSVPRNRPFTSVMSRKSSATTLGDRKSDASQGDRKSYDPQIDELDTTVTNTFEEIHPNIPPVLRKSKTKRASRKSSVHGKLVSGTTKKKSQDGNKS